MRAAVVALLCIAMCMPSFPGTHGASGRTADANGSFDTAAELSATENFINGNLDVLDDKADFYKLPATAGDTINISVYIIDYVPSGPGQVDFNLGLFNPSRVLLGWSNSTYRRDTLNELAVVGGTYYIEVNATSGSGNYTLEYSAGPPQIVRDGTTIHGSLANNTNRNADWFRVSLRGGASPDLFTATMHEEGSQNFDLYFMDLWSGYSFWYDISWASDPDERVEAVATYSGYYYLKVYDYLGTGSYTLNITVAPAASGHAQTEPAGAKNVPYNSSLGGHVDMAMVHYNWYRTVLAQGETITASMRLDPQPSDMFALSILQPDFGTLEGWSKTNYVDGTPPTLARTVTVSKTAPAAGTYYIVAMAKVGLMASIVDLSDRNAASDFVITINLSAHIPPPVNHPPAASPAGMTVEVDRNKAYKYDLGRIFSDPDGDALRFTVSGAVHIAVDIDAGQNNASFLPAHNWYGSENITITAADPYDMCATAWVNITVRHNPLPPEILDRSPAEGALNASNGTILRFRVHASDPDGGPVTYGWKAAGAALASNINYTDWKVPGDGGTVEINLTVSAGNLSASAVWVVTCKSRPALEVSITNPLNNTNVKQGERVVFNAMAQAIPASELANFEFSWYLGSENIGEGSSFCTTSLPAGKNTVEIRVHNKSEPAQNGRKSVVVFVSRKEAAENRPLDLVIAVAAFAIAAAAGAAIVVLSRRKRPAADNEVFRPVDEGTDGERRRARRRSRRRRRARKEQRGKG